MPGLFGIYGSASQSLLAFQNAMATVGHNVANAGTPGFHRQRVELATNNPQATQWGGLGAGVRIDTIHRIEDRFIEQAIERELPVLSRFEARASTLKQAELVFGEPSDEGGLTAILDRFFTSWDDLASNPEDLGARQSVVQDGISLATSVAASRERLFDQQQNITQELERSVDDANRLASELVTLNQSIMSARRNGQVPPDLEDRRDQITEALAELVGSSSQIEGDGTATVRIGGRIIVQAESAEPLTYDGRDDGSPRLGGTELNAQVVDGRIGGLLEVRDVELQGAIEALDSFALDLATRVNDIHRAGLDFNGDEGEDFFVFENFSDETGDPARAAQAMRVNLNLIDDPARVAAGASGGTGDSTIAHDIAGLRNEASGPVGQLRSLIVTVASRSRHAEDVATGQRTVVDSFEAQRESISGVSLDEEAANLLRFQRSYQASAQIMATADEMLQTLLSL